MSYSIASSNVAVGQTEVYCLRTGAGGVLTVGRDDAALAGNVRVQGNFSVSALTGGRALATDAGGNLVSAATTAAELSYVSGVTSGIQTQLAGKQATITGAATTVTSSDLTASRAMASDSSGKVGVSSVTAAELSYVSGVTSGIQTQINTINANAGTGTNLSLSGNLTAAGNVSATGYFLGNGALLSGVATTSGTNLSLSGNLSVAGAISTASISTGTGTFAAANVAANAISTNTLSAAGLVTTSGNVSAAGMTASGNVSATGLVAIGTASAGNVYTAGNVSAAGLTASGNVTCKSLLVPDPGKVDCTTIQPSGGGLTVIGSLYPTNLYVSSALEVLGSFLPQQISERLSTKTGATGVVAHDFTTGAIWYHSSIAANFTCNLTNVPTTNGRTIVTTLVLVQGATPYMCNAFQIDGVAQTLKWQGGTAPTGTASKLDAVTFSLLRTGSAWTVLGQNANFG